jgi:lipopolysaccharide biosynthesis glycosyltransferase
MKSKNLVFMLDIDIKGDGRYASSRRASYKYSIDSWKKWCDKNDCELFVLNDLLMSNDIMGICWQRYYLFDILDANEVEYDQVLMIDADTIVHPECPNFFDMSEGKLCGAQFDGSWDWVLRSLENYSKYVFENEMITWYEYIDCGFVLMNKNHKDFCKKIVNFYHQNSNLLKEMQEKFTVGTDQTPVNFLIHKENIEFKLLPYEFNMCDMNRKEILGDDLLFTKLGWIYQYNAIPNNKDNQFTNYFMKKTYEHFYGEYSV